MPGIVSKLVEVLSDGAPVRGLVPAWEDPINRFLRGTGEINLQSIGGRTTSIFELLVHSKDDQFPFWLAGKNYSKKELLRHVAMVIGPEPDLVKKWVQQDGYEMLWDMCIENDCDPKLFY